MSFAEPTLIRELRDKKYSETEGTKEVRRHTACVVGSRLPLAMTEPTATGAQYPCRMSL
jgi:hypothetical protein